MWAMDSKLQASIDRADDPRLIPGIYNYCNRRCEKCQFTERCLAFADIRESERAHPDRGVFHHVHASFQQTFDMLHAWCEREGIDFEKLRHDANSDEASAEIRDVDEAVEGDRVHTLAMTYTHAAFKIVNALEQAAPLQVWS